MGLTKWVKSEQGPKDLKGRESETWVCGEEHSRQQKGSIERARRNTSGLFGWFLLF